MNKEIVVKLKNLCGSLMKHLAENPSPAIVFLFLVVLGLGFLIFYQYDVLVETSEPKTSGEAVQFQKELYQQILKEWEVRDERFETASSKNYINPFQSKKN